MTARVEVAFIGRVGGNPEFKLVRDGTMPFLTFSVVVNDSADQDAPGQWFRCVAFKESAERLNGMLAKGDKVYIEGRLKLPVEIYQPRNADAARASLEVLVNLAQPLGQIGRRRPRQVAQQQHRRVVGAHAPNGWAAGR